MMIESVYYRIISDKENSIEIKALIRHRTRTTEIGNIVVYRVCHKILKINVSFWETHSSVKKKYHNQGIGLALYDTAISHALNLGLKITSSSGPSEMALRVWRSKRLNSKYRIYKIGRRFWVLNKK